MGNLSGGPRGCGELEWGTKRMWRIGVRGLRGCGEFEWEDQEVVGNLSGRRGENLSGGTKRMWGI